MKLKLFFAATLLATSTFAIADAYRAEVGANAAHWDMDVFNSSSNIYDVNGKYYFNLVQTDNLPLAEAAYLGKSSKIYSGGVEVYIPENFLYIKVEGIHQRYPNSSDTSALTTVGLTPLDGLRVTTSWNSDESYHANVDAKYVTDIGNGHYINVEARLADTDLGTYKAIGADYYFDNTFSAGVEVSDEELGKTYLARTRKFFTEQFSADLTYADTDFGNIYAVGVDYRF